MNGPRKSDRPVVPAKLPNKAGRPAAEAMEGRGLAKGNSPKQNRDRSPSWGSLPSKLERIRRIVKEDKKARIRTLAHHVYDMETLRWAYHSLKRGAAPGEDGVTWRQYGEALEENLQDLADRLRRGGYRARPVRRVYIPKADGRQRPLGVTALEDKIVQRAVVEVLNTIYENDFVNFSYGFRSNRNQHQALDALYAGLFTRKINWVLDADIRAFFDALCHSWVVRFLEHRVADRWIIRMIQKWLKAGVMEEGVWRSNDEGSPQGGNISPLLANIYLHYVLDLWARRWRKRDANGDMIIVRYADDFIVGFEHRSDAERFLTQLRERMVQFRLELHAEKTRLIEFGRFAAIDRKRRGDRKPETFDFLGFTHICGKTRDGRFTIVRQTIRKRMQAKLTEVRKELRRRLHDAVPEVGSWLASVVRGHFRYYGVPMNSHALYTFRHRVIHHWYQAIQRRSQKTRLNWERMKRLADRWLPPAHICHPYPLKRIGVAT